MMSEIRILVVNPNSTESMTEKIATAASLVSQPGTKIVAATSKSGPPSIQGYYDIALCESELITEVSNHKNIDAVVIACFDDTGVDAVRCMVDVPVIGIGEAAYHAASMLASQFSVVTTLSRSVARLESNLLRYGLSAKCAKVRSTDIPVLKLEQKDPETIKSIEDCIQEAITQDRAEAVVLGCAGMADLMQQLSEKFGIPVIDGVSCATTFSEALVRSGLKTSKINTYAYPL